MSYRKFYEKYMPWLENVRSKTYVKSSTGCQILSENSSYHISCPRIYQEEKHGEVRILDYRIILVTFLPFSTIMFK